MSLKLADKLVKQGDYVGALKAIVEAKKAEPGNRYAAAYEERVRMLLKESAGTSSAVRGPEAASALPRPQQGTEGMPSAEHQMRALATRVLRTGTKADSPDSKKLAIRAKLASLVTSARELSAQERHDEALDTLARAVLLDPNSLEIHTLEQQIRAAQASTRLRNLKVQQERDSEEKRRRERAQQEELDRLKADQKRKQDQEEAQRRSAQEQKAAQSLRRVREFLLADQLDEAQCELAFVSVLAPGTSEVVALEAELAIRRQDRERSIQEAHHRQIEEQRERELKIRQETEAAILEAEALSKKDRFDEALRLLTDAYLNDPGNAEIEAVEERIITAKRIHAEQVAVQRREQEEAKRRAEAEEDERRRAEERARLHEEEVRQQESRRQAAEQQLANHLHAASAYLADRRFKEALAEVALAFVIDPFHAEVKQMEQRIMQEQASAKEKKAPVSASILPPEEEADLEAIAHHLAEAKHLASRQRYLPALHEIEKALAIDPESIVAKRLASTIRDEFQQSQIEMREALKKPSTPAPSSEPGSRPSAADTRAEGDFVDHLIDARLQETGMAFGELSIEKPPSLLKRWLVRALTGLTAALVAWVSSPPQESSSPSPGEKSDRVTHTSQTTSPAARGADLPPGT
jgi:hypothetical protein